MEAVLPLRNPDNLPEIPSCALLPHSLFIAPLPSSCHESQQGLSDPGPKRVLGPAGWQRIWLKVWDQDLGGGGGEGVCLGQAPRGAPGLTLEGSVVLCRRLAPVGGQVTCPCGVWGWRATSRFFTPQLTDIGAVSTFHNYREYCGGHPCTNFRDISFISFPFLVQSFLCKTDAFIFVPTLTSSFP